MGTTRTVAMSTRRFKAYLAHKDSGVEWLGKIPAHWATKRLKFVTQRRHRDGTLSALPPDTEVSFVPMEAIGENGGLDLSRTRSISDVSAGYTFFRDGDILVAKITPCFENGKGALANGLVNGIGFGTTELYVLRPTADLENRFLYYISMTDAFRRLGVAEMSGAGGQKRIPDSFISDFRQCVPTIAEQREISYFLDKKTAEIDTLVAKNERLIELLHERRMSLITRAVTKGLDAHVSMRDSGVEWLGQIPAHWEVQRLKNGTSKIGSGKTPSGGAEVYVPNGVIFLRSQNVHFDGLLLDDVAFIDEQVDAEMAPSRVNDGDVLLNITGASLGRCCVAQLNGMRANVNQHVCVIRPKATRYVPTFLANALSSPAVQAQIFASEDGISRDALNFEQIAELEICHPPLAEQRRIASFLERKTAEIDSLVGKIRQAIGYLRELRSGLIADVVTGKVDVRERTA